MRRLSLWMVILLVTCLLFVVIGCGEEAVDPPAENGVDVPDADVPQEIVFGAGTETPSLDPFLEASDERSKRTVLLYEGLTWVDHNMVIQPAIAESWDISEDGTVYTFNIRQNAYFHNGEQVTADDVEYSYRLFLDEDFPTAGRGDFAPVQEVNKVDDFTVEFVLAEPYATLLAAVGGRYGAVVPEGTYDGGSDLRNTALGTGPYMLTDWVVDNRMILERFEQHWNEDIAHLDKITVQIIPSEDSLLAGLRSGEMDMAILGDPRSYLLIEGAAGLVVERHEALRWSTMEFANDTSPADDVRVRQAVLLAIDKEEIVASAIDGVGTVIGVMPSAFSDWVVPRDELPNQQRDLDAARALLEDAGYPDGLELPLRIIAGFVWMRPAAEVIASNLSEVGIDVQIETVELGVWIQDWTGYQQPNCLNEWGGFTDPDLLYYRHFRARPVGGDWRRWDSEESSRILDAARSTADYEERLALYTEFQELMATEVPSIPLFSADDVSVRQENVLDYIHHPSGWWYGLVYARVQ